MLSILAGEREFMKTAGKKIQYRHDMYNNQTYCVNPPSLFALKMLAESYFNHGPASVEFELGISKVHPKDQYSRKIGRQVALGKLKTYKFDIKYVGRNDNNKIFMVLKHNNLQLYFSLTIGKEIPFLTNVEYVS